jgi:hypothetical protein
MLDNRRNALCLVHVLRVSVFVVGDTGVQGGEAAVPAEDDSDH